MSRPKKNPDFINKTCEGCKKEFIISYRKKRQRFCNKSCAQNTSSVQEKMKASQLLTYQKKYGVDHPMKTNETKQKFKKTMLKIYGVESALLNPYSLEKLKYTNFKKYGTKHYNNHEKYKLTCLEKYGVDNIGKLLITSEKSKQTRYDLHYNYIKSLCDEKNISLLFSKESYIGYDFKNKYKFKCNICNKHFETDVYKISHIFCEVCNPLDNDTLENDLFKFITSILPENITVKRNDRTILNGKELDIYIPFKKIAIELNGLYWHSENGRGIKKHYHLNKYKSCIGHGIKLIHVFENEWNDKKNIIKSILQYSIGLTTNNIFARNCIIKEISEHTKNEFLTKNHLQGKDNSSIKYGIYNNEELISVMTFGKSRFDKNIEYEMFRFCNKLNIGVIGGADKLFKHFIKENSPKTVVSYNDRRFFNGSVYNKLGFNFIKNTPPNYWYIKQDYKMLYNRMTFQKHKLKKILNMFDPNLTEWENMKNNGYDRIWDCGNGKWVWKS